MSETKLEREEPRRSLDNVLSVLGQDNRLRVLRLLCEAEAGIGVTTLASKLNVSPPTIVGHLKILSEMGFVKKDIFDSREDNSYKQRWAIKGQKRVVKLLSLLENEVRSLAEVGELLITIDSIGRTLEKQSQEGMSVEEKMEHESLAGRLDSSLARIVSDKYVELLDDKELKGVKFWKRARDTGFI